MVKHNFYRHRHGKWNKYHSLKGMHVLRVFNYSLFKYSSRQKSTCGLQLIKERHRTHGTRTRLAKPLQLRYRNLSSFWLKFFFHQSTWSPITINSLCSYLCQSVFFLSWPNQPNLTVYSSFSSSPMFFIDRDGCQVAHFWRSY